MHYDVFNGDADGLCAMLQLQLVQPRPDARLISGPKRQINLLSEVACDAQQVRVVDISMLVNAADLTRLLNAGAQVFYADHHFPGSIPTHANLQAQIDLCATTCSALIVNRFVDNANPLWAIAGAFGDNLYHSARALAQRVNLRDSDTDLLCQVGRLLNYNGYGLRREDLHFSPEELLKRLQTCTDPRDFACNSAEFRKLAAGFDDDSNQSKALSPTHSNQYCAVYQLPNQPWARRISGTFGNDLARTAPDRAHAVVVLTSCAQETYNVSLRAPLNNPVGADQFCRRYPSGGGRAAAAGINHLKAADVPAFIASFCDYYQSI